MRGMQERAREVMDWLREFEAACRGRDFASGRRLFAEEAVAFGTWATAVSGLASRASATSASDDVRSSR